MSAVVVSDEALARAGVGPAGLTKIERPISHGQ